MIGFDIMPHRLRWALRSMFFVPNGLRLQRIMIDHFLRNGLVSMSIYRSEERRVRYGTSNYEIEID